MQHESTLPRSLRNLLRVPALGLALLCLGGADDCEQQLGGQPQREPSLEITRIHTDHADALPGDSITIEFELQDAHLLRRTEVRRISHLFRTFDPLHVTAPEVLDPSARR